MRRERIYVSAPMDNPKLGFRDLNVDRFKRAITKLAEAGYHPLHAPVFTPNLSSEKYKDIAREAIEASSRLFAIPYRNGMVPSEMWEEIIYAQRAGVSVFKFSNEEELDKWLNAKIFTFTGPSGAGKTTIVRELLKWSHEDFKILTSITTRKPRESDLPGEYRYVSEEEFIAMKERGEFIWPKPDEELPIHGNMYGTTKRSVDEALNAPHRSIMLLVPDVLDMLYDYTDDKVWSFYIFSPPEDVLRRRLSERGDDSQDIDRRIIDCKRWDAKARARFDTYTFIRNEGSLYRTVRDLSLYLP